LFLIIAAMSQIPKISQLYMYDLFLIGMKAKPSGVGYFLAVSF